MDAIERELKPVGDAELVIDLPEIILDHLLGSANFGGNFLVAHSLGDTGDDEQLLVRELGLRTRRGELCGLRTICLNYPVDALIVQPGLAGGDLAHTL